MNSTMKALTSTIETTASSGGHNERRLDVVMLLAAILIVMSTAVFGADQGAHFVQVANLDNISGNETIIDHALTNANPGAIIQVTKNWSPPGGLGPYNTEAFGVFYNETEHKWAVFNESPAVNMVNNTGFNVWVPPVDASTFVHTADASNTSNWITRIDNPLTNNNPAAVLLVTQCWNPSGGLGVYNNRIIGVWYDDASHRWAIYNQDAATTMPVGAAFNVSVLSIGATALVHTALPSNTIGHVTDIDNPMTNNNPDAIVSVTQRFNAGGGVGGIYNNHAIGVYYDTVHNQWAIFNEDLTDLPNGAVFNVAVLGHEKRAAVHTSTVLNTSLAATSLNQPLTNDNPNALVFVTQNWNPPGGAFVYNDHEPGVFFGYSTQRWEIFNEDLANMPEGASFNIWIPPVDARSFVHTSRPANSAGATTKIDHLALNNDPNAIIHATQNLNPSGVSGVYNNHPIGVYYNEAANQWAVFNEDYVSMPDGASFNIWIPPVDSSTFVHTATASNTFGDYTTIDHAETNLHPDAIVLVTQNWNPSGGIGVYNAHHIGVFYDSYIGQWAIFNQDTSTMPDGASFNVTVLDPLFVDGFESGTTSAWSAVTP